MMCLVCHSEYRYSTEYSCCDIVFNIDWSDVSHYEELHLAAKLS